MMTDAEAAAIQERADKATESNILFAGALATSILRVASFQSDAKDEANVLFAINARTDIPALLADRAERTRLLRERIIPKLGEIAEYLDETLRPDGCEPQCGCVACLCDALLAEITEAVR